MNTDPTVELSSAGSHDQSRIKEAVARDFERFMGQGTLGFFSGCEITSAFLLGKDDRPVNYYTLVVFQEDASIGSSVEYLTRSGSLTLKKKREWRLGIKRWHWSLAEVFGHFQKLLAEKEQKSLDGSLLLGHVRPVPRQFVPAGPPVRLGPLDPEAVPMNAVLKRVANYPSYVIEFFDESKASPYDPLSGLDREFVAERIKELSGTDLALVEDRIGNLVFQFPVTVVQDFDEHPRADRVGIHVTWHPKLKTPPPTRCQVRSVFDGNLLCLGEAVVDQSGDCEVIVENADVPSSLIIYNPTDQLVYYYGRNKCIVNFSSPVAVCRKQDIRVFEVNGVTQRVQLQRCSRGGQIVEPAYISRIGRRVRRAELQRLEASGEFRQYGGPNRRGTSEHKRAVEDIRALIREAEHGILLWDQFASPQDIVATLLFAETWEVPVRVIVEQQTAKRHWTAQECQCLRDARASVGLNLEVRTPDIGTGRGWGFHDRFLVLLPNPNLHEHPQVWSLGTSLNSLGEKHHLLLQVPHPDAIVEAFDSLWASLDYPNCRVYSTSGGSTSSSNRGDS